MKNFTDIVEEIKDIVSADFPGKKVFDKDIAELLGISQMNFATMKKRHRHQLAPLRAVARKSCGADEPLLYGPLLQRSKRIGRRGCLQRR